MLTIEVNEVLKVFDDWHFVFQRQDANKILCYDNAGEALDGEGVVLGNIFFKNFLPSRRSDLSIVSFSFEGNFEPKEIRRIRFK